jgi:ferric-dicitrate binding protein FerR (iron transport regulator)
MTMKQRPDLLILALVGLAVAAATLAAPGADPVVEKAGWKAVAASGRVEARVDSAVEWYPVRRGERVAAASVIRTGARSRATLARGASIVLVDPQSELILPTAAPGGPSTVFQASGSVIYHVNGLRDTEFRVETPYLVAGVKGTEFLVSVADGRASVTVRRGLVEVTTGRAGERHQVRAGETLVLREEAEAGTVERVDRRGAPVDATAEATGDTRHVAWKQGRRLDDARRELAHLLDSGALRDLDGPDTRAESVTVDAGTSVGEDKTLVDPVPIDPVTDTDERDELIEDLTNETRKNGTSSEDEDDGQPGSTNPPPAPTP